MTATIERAAKPLAAMREEAELQRPVLEPSGKPFPSPVCGPYGQDTAPKGPPAVVTQYMTADFFALPGEVSGRRVVRALDPAKWPHPPEPDCQKEWDELGE